MKIEQKSRNLPVVRTPLEVQVQNPYIDEDSRISTSVYRYLKRINANINTVLHEIKKIKPSVRKYDVQICAIENGIRFLEAFLGEDVEAFAEYKNKVYTAGYRQEYQAFFEDMFFDFDTSDFHSGSTSVAIDKGVLGNLREFAGKLGSKKGDVVMWALGAALHSTVLIPDEDAEYYKKMLKNLHWSVRRRLKEAERIWNSIKSEKRKKSKKNRGKDKKLYRTFDFLNNSSGWNA